MVRWSLETFGNVEWPQSITRQLKEGVITLRKLIKGAAPWSRFDSCPDF